MKKKLLLVLAACAVGVTFSVVAADRAASTPSGPADCATLAMPVNSEYHTSYSPTRGELAIGFVDAAGRDQRVVVDVSAPSCRANRAVARAIAGALDAQADVMAGECASFKAFLASGETTAKGEPVNVDAARAYVRNHCG